MTEKFDVAMLVGSLRQNSYSGRVANALIKLAPPELSLKILPIGGLPFYNQDLEAAPPAEWVAFRQAIAATSGVLFVTPEYNRSVPGVLKNAIDVASRPGKSSVFNGKPAAVVSQSPGLLGGFGANHHLRQSLVSMNMPAMQAPEAYISRSGTLFDDSGALTNQTTAAFLTTFLQAFAAWIALITKPKG
ncbi:MULTISPECIES: NADPH-dependent FMN reductase [Rhodomicrobium]|uniref:NADPH-dependent FMN reductase n=1 Tax=Rhodomicrobium TaxID=1068 RepID=UPI000B4A6C2B|nr:MULTISPECIES: NADPH-dependent FMN reductase [Rhodomicrobium]